MVDPGVLAFKANLMEGPQIGLLTLAGIRGAEEVDDVVWNELNWQSLLDQCPAATVIDEYDSETMEDEEEIESFPEMSDRYFKVYVDDPLELTRHLREAVLAIFKPRT
jgi:hypothetical protein